MWKKTGAYNWQTNEWSRDIPILVKRGDFDENFNYYEIEDSRNELKDDNGRSYFGNGKKYLTNNGDIVVFGE